MDIEELESVSNWVGYYRGQFQLPVEERGGYVMLPVTNQVGVVHIPRRIAGRVLQSLLQQDIPAPLIARQIRWTMIAAVDYWPDHQVLDLLSRNDICVPVVGSALMLPTSFEQVTREGSYWVNPPDRDRLLPWLSTVVSTALTQAAEPRGGRFTP